jgi:trehalose 6-phosphate synthase
MNRTSMRLERFTWTRERLHSLVTKRLEGFRFICVANREPYIHVSGPRGIRCVEPDSGVVTALDPVMRATGGTWIAHGSGSADRETADPKGRLRVPPGRPHYTLRRVWLSPEEERGYYYGFSNEGLWPLCHIAYQRPMFRDRDWKQYAAVNQAFADAVVEEIAGERALVFIQDYHFALLSKLIKQKLPGAIVCQFWHIPWPNSEAFRICPWTRDVLEGMLGNDLMAFHTQNHCNNFLESVDRELESRIDRESFSVTLRGSHTAIRPHPISVDFDAISAAAESSATQDRMAALQERYRLSGLAVLLAVGRMDYTKGILERVQAVDRLLELHPELVEKTVLLEIAVRSRSQIAAYGHFQDQVESLIEAVNKRHRTSAWEPIVLIREHQDQPTLTALYRLADLCLVTSLHDGMNLVAKEYVSARVDEQGALLLSHFTGAARELTHALLVNPYAVDATADMIWKALTMTAEEKQCRMRKMREVVREHNVYRWAGKLLEQAARLEPS